jgi:hypothetical protein
MGVQVYKTAKAPEQWALAENEEEHLDNRNGLLFAGGDDPADDIDYPDDGLPALDPYSVSLHVTMSFKCDETLRDMIDAVGFAHDFSRSEIMRRLMFLGITRLDGRLERVPAPAQSEAA